jgi:hypothetical protein
VYDEIREFWREMSKLLAAIREKIEAIDLEDLKEQK